MKSKVRIRVSSSTYLFCFYFTILFVGFTGRLSLEIDAAAVSAASFTCKNGTIAKCNEEEEMRMMESEISPRLIAQQKYISLGALLRNRAFCKGRDSRDTYNCLPPPSNPHTRGCSKYHRCRSDS